MDDLIADDDFLGFGGDAAAVDDVDALVADDEDLFRNAAVPTVSKRKREPDFEVTTTSGGSGAKRVAAAAPAPAAAVQQQQQSSLFLTRSGVGLLGEDEGENEDALDEDASAEYVPSFNFDTTGGDAGGQTWDPIRKEWRSSAVVDPDAWRAT